MKISLSMKGNVVSSDASLTATMIGTHKLNGLQPL